MSIVYIYVPGYVTDISIFLKKRSDFSSQISLELAFTLISYSKHIYKDLKTNWSKVT